MPIPEKQIFTLNGTPVHAHTLTPKKKKSLLFNIYWSIGNILHCVFPLFTVINILKIKLKTSETPAVLEPETFTCYIIIYAMLSIQKYTSAIVKSLYSYLSPYHPDSWVLSLFLS